MEAMYSCSKYSQHTSKVEQLEENVSYGGNQNDRLKQWFYTRLRLLTL